MKENSTVVLDHWYRHVNFKDVAIEIMCVTDTNVLAAWWNVSGGKRRFLLEYEWIPLEKFERSPYWVDQGDSIVKLPEHHL